MTPRRSLFLFVLAILVVAISPFAFPLWKGDVFSFRDHFDYFVPLRHFTAEILRGGELPLWNPYNGSGEPWLANPQTGVFYPPAWLFVLLPFARAYPLFLCFHLALLGVGGLFLFRVWSSDGSALLASVGLTMAGPTLSFLDVNNNLATFAWYPLVILTAIERGRISPRIPRSAAAAVVTLMFLGGEPYLALVGAILWVGFFGAFAERPRAGEIAVVGLLSALLASAQLVPFLELLRGSERAEGLDLASALRQSVTLRDWMAAALSPVVSGSAVKLFAGGQQFLPLLYIGLPLLAGAVGGVLLVTRDKSPAGRASAAWIAVFAASALISASGHLPLLEGAMRAVHFTFLRHPSRMVAVAVLALAGLAALGFDALRRSRAGVRAAIFVVCLAAAAAAWWLNVRPGAAFDSRGVAEQLALVAICALGLLRPAVLERRVACLAGAAIIASDLFLAALPLFATTPFPPRTGWDSLIGQHRKVARVETERNVRWTLPERTSLVSGYLNLFGRTFDLSTPAPVVPADYLWMDALARSGARRDLLDFLSVGYVIAPRPLEAPGFRLLSEDSGTRLYANGYSNPMVSVWSSSIETPTPSAALRLVRSGAFDARRVVAITGRSDPAPAAGAVDAKLRYVLDPQKAGLDADLTRAAIVVITQRSAPGWEVRVDGKMRKGLVADGMFRAVAVPAGRHQIEWTYHPASLRAGVAGSIAGLILVIGDVASFLHVRRRGQTAPIKKTSRLRKLAW